MALGHPLGVTGARLALTTTRELHDRKARRAVATMCIGIARESRSLSNGCGMPRLPNHSQERWITQSWRPCSKTTSVWKFPVHRPCAGSAGRQFPASVVQPARSGRPDLSPAGLECNLSPSETVDPDKGELVIAGTALEGPRSARHASRRQSSVVECQKDERERVRELPEHSAARREREREMTSGAKRERAAFFFERERESV